MLAFLLPLILAVVYEKWFHPCIWKPIDYLLLTLEAKDCSGISFNNTFNLQVWEPLLETSLSYSSRRLIDKRMKFQQFWADWRQFLEIVSLLMFPGSFTCAAATPFGGFRVPFWGVYTGIPILWETTTYSSKCTLH